MLILKLFFACPKNHILVLSFVDTFFCSYYFFQSNLFIHYIKQTLTDEWFLQKAYR